MEAAAEERRSATVLDLQAYTFYNFILDISEGKNPRRRSEIPEPF